MIIIIDSHFQQNTTQRSDLKPQTLPPQSHPKAMNKNMTNIIMQRSYQGIGNLDLMPLIEKLKPKQGETAIVTSTILRKQLVNNECQWIFDQNLVNLTLVMTRLQGGDFCNKLFRSLASIRRNFFKLAFWDCNLDQSFFIALAKADWKFVFLIFRNCFVSGEIVKSISMLDLSRLTYLWLGCDAITNKHVSYLIPHIPKVKKLILQNTLVTNDVVKVISKKVQKYGSLAVICQDLFDDLTFSRLTVKQKQKQKERYYISHDKKQFFFPSLSKFQFDNEQQSIQFKFGIVQTYINGHQDQYDFFDIKWSSLRCLQVLSQKMVFIIDLTSCY